MVNVYVWNMKWGSVGHAALEIDGYGPKVYVSWWPAGRSVGALFGGVPARPHVDLREDITDEDRSPSQQIEMYGLHEAPMRDAWNRIRSTANYELWESSCATTVAKLLEAGGGGSYARPPVWVVWTPDDVATYAREINAGYSRVEWRMFMADMA
jgi:hypothetical protein